MQSRPFFSSKIVSKRSSLASFLLDADHHHVILFAADGNYETINAAHKATLIVVRPDGYIGYESGKLESRSLDVFLNSYLKGD